MLYCYKTSFSPLINQKHEWSDCNYSHRQQDFRRPPNIFFYQNEKCSYISEDGSWETCPDQLDCTLSHTLVELLYNPLSLKQKECTDKLERQQYSCTKRGDLCSLYHSLEEKELANMAVM